jgi:hypothetical protein
MAWRTLQLLDSMPIGRVCHLVHVELFKLVDQALIAERSGHFVKSSPMPLWVLHTEVLIVESRAPSLEP